MLTILLVILFLTLLLLMELKRRQLSVIVKHIPGPKELPIFGSHYVFKSEDITDFQKLDSQDCVASVVKIFLGPKLLLVVSDPAVLQQLLGQCQEKPYLVNFFNLEFGLFSAKYPIWKPLRKGLSPAFSQRVSNSFIPIFDKHYANLCKAFSDKLDTYDFNFHSYVQRQSFHLTLETTLNSTLTDDYIDLHSFEEVEDIIGQRTMASHLHADFIYKRTKMYKREREIRASIEAMIDRILEDKYLKMKDEEYLTEQSNSHIFIDQLMHLTQDGRELTPLEIRQNIIAIIFAGYETTAVTITYAILMLAMHPEIEKLVVQEIDEFYKKGDVIDYDLLKNLNYLEMVVKETMRLFPSVPLTIRESIEDMNLEGVGMIPKGVTFICSFYRLHRWKDIWGSDANEFRPERFSQKKMLKDIPLVSYLLVVAREIVWAIDMLC
ncbi:probable cytochrome P450 313a1 [Culicoides brevitarsis]|uniref:probable cytochrome P450 313a1 n=1 Tax=Culicoides brevitarsis TaxID=469753 RepID=UPI00307C340A